MSLRVLPNFRLRVKHESEALMGAGSELVPSRFRKVWRESA